jgi:hypothetical protein
VRILHLCGIPGAGKSSFGAWLAAKHDFVHVNVDETGGDLSAFVAAIASNRDVVLDYGFPPNAIPRIREMQQQLAMESWWFEGDAEACFRSFKQAKGTGAPWLAARQKYLSDIAEHRSEYDALVGDQRIRTVEADDTRLSGEEIYRRIWPAG